MTGQDGEKYVASEVVCTGQEIYDPYLGFCRQVLTCPGNFKFNGEACVGELENGHVLINDTFIKLTLHLYTDVDVVNELMDVEEVIIPTFIGLQIDDIHVMALPNEVRSSFSDVGHCFHDTNITIVNFKATGSLVDISFDELMLQMSEEILNHCFGTEQKIVVNYIQLSNFENVSILEAQCNRNLQKLISYSSSQISVTNINETTMVVLTTDEGSIQLVSSSVPQIVTLYSNGTQREAFLCETMVSCDYITLEPDEFEWVGDDKHILKHIPSGRKIPKEEIIFEGDTIQICNFFDKYQANYFQYSKIQTIINIVGCSISVAALFITILTYSIFSELRNVPGKTVLSLSVAMIIAQLLLLLGTGLTIYPVCLTVAMLMQFSWIAVFAWTNILSFDLARTFGSHATLRDKSSASTFIKYSVYAWGLPILLVCLTVIIHFMVRINGDTEALYDLINICWLKAGTPLLVAFGTPVGVLLLGNIVFFVYTIVGIRYTRKATAILDKEGTDKLKQIKEDLYLTCRVSVILILMSLQ